MLLKRFYFWNEIKISLILNFIKKTNLELYSNFLLEIILKYSKYKNIIKIFICLKLH